jgi:carboxypeptidase C (cathepsin A)
MRRISLAVLTALLLGVTLAARDYDLVKSMPFGCNMQTKWYSGYLKTTSAQRSLHYVYIESKSKPSTDPVLVWFNGGPGCSSMLGLIQEHGPCVIEDFTDKVVDNPYPWNMRANLLYLESPGGVGYSYAATSQDVKYTDHSQSVDTFAALRDWYQGFPEYITNPLYITGESYAGIYAPFLAEQIHEWNEEVVASRAYSNSPRSFYPLSGFIIGNGVTDWRWDGPYSYAEALFDNGRITKEIFDEYKSINCEIWYRDLKTKDNPQRCYEI